MHLEGGTSNAGGKLGTYAALREDAEMYAGGKVRCGFCVRACKGRERMVDRYRAGDLDVGSGAVEGV